MSVALSAKAKSECDSRDGVNPFVGVVNVDLTSVSVNGAEMLSVLVLVSLSLASDDLLVDTGCSSDAEEFPNGIKLSVDDEALELLGRWEDEVAGAFGGYDVGGSGLMDERLKKRLKPEVRRTRSECGAAPPSRSLGVASDAATPSTSTPSLYG